MISIQRLDYTLVLDNGSLDAGDQPQKARREQLVAVNHRLHDAGSVVGLNYCNYFTRKLMLTLARTRTGAQRY